AAMDRNVGHVLDKIDSLGLKNDTIVIFLNDNGGGGSTDLYADHSRNYADNSPYKGHKFDLYEGGIRTPFYMRWPGNIKKGSVYKDMVSSMDIFPTVVKAADLKLPEQACDGKNLIPHLNKPSIKAPHPWLCWENRNWSQFGKAKYCQPRHRIHNSAIRKDDWKLVRYFNKIDSKGDTPPWQLYDLSKDVSEKTDVAKQHPEVVKELNQIFSKWRTSMHPSVAGE
ncbi:MAG: sulfatase-like hydrolase/transferase, partial [Desulfobulbaceae bacterium]|nr:sulfatase-like hydrolase/transferase [Desulfobulbaceae bacterium]